MKTNIKIILTGIFAFFTVSLSAHEGIDPAKKAFEKWNRQFVSYPAVANEVKEQGLVYVSFELTEKGEAENVVIESGSNEVLNEKALEMIESMPKSHLYANGFIEGTRFVVPIQFKIQ